ncbi:glycosyltransferase family 4 protein [Paenibacillus sp. MWE-103]|uniref:Glycosyltransferase family 4 protein n=1 Tax=Paenibacillus artemisiicola TaxID=1172618 RepID=A0ABS3W3D4_9BACL|nr:glycosyltransferase family 4 protein [Paenibacillus artemisiicola]MBO7742815.1 glycosyltransferase family 4 protein [Paenibacillus artemisiicola]
MKVLFTFFNPSGGMETLNRIRCKALNQQKVECHLLYTVDGNGRRNIKNIPTFVTNDEAAIKRLVDRERYDAVVVCSDVVLMQLLRRIGYEGLLIFEIQGLGTLKTASDILRDIAGRVLQTADAVLYPETSHIRQLMNENMPGVPHFCFDDPLDTKDFGYVSYPPKPFPVIGWVGRIEENKNWRDFLLIGARLAALEPTCYLWVFGDLSLGEPREKALFEQWVDALRLREKLVMHANIPHEQMADYMSIIGDSGGFLLSTSILEGFGYAVAEAMLCRCPVLTTDSDGIRRFLEHDVTGKLYPRTDIAKAVQAAQSLMGDAPLRRRIVKQAERHIKTHFSCEKYADNFLRMLASLKEARVRS